jgi:hypothetical protein
VIRSAGLRAPRAAAVAGIVFSVLLAVALVLIRVSVPSDASEAGRWLTDAGRRRAVTVALNLVPFAGIAFLWFIGVVRDRIGQHEDRLFATVFLGSGLLFIGMLFVAAAVAGGLLADPAIQAGRTPSPGSWRQGRNISLIVLNTYAMRMGAVFILSTTTIALRTGIVPRWLGLGGYVVAVTLLIGVGFSGWVNLVLPVWVFVLSVHILVFSLRAGGRTEGGTPGVAGAEPG